MIVHKTTHILHQLHHHFHETYQIIIRQIVPQTNCRTKFSLPSQLHQNNEINKNSMPHIA